MKNVGLILVGAALATVLIFTTAQDNAPVANYSSSMSVERLASRMERFMKMHVEVVRNQMELNTSLRKLTSLQIDNAKKFNLDKKNLLISIKKTLEYETK